MQRINTKVCLILIFLFVFFIKLAAQDAPKTLHRSDSLKIDSVSRLLNDTVIALDEVVIQEQKKLFRWSGNEMLIDVANTDLKNETSIGDLMKRIPGMRVANDKIEVLGRAAPVYYINDRKVLSYYEVEMLPIKDIHSIRLILSPGVEYDSDGAPVILIKTKHKTDGYTVQVSPTVSYARRLFHNEDLNLTLHTKYVDVFGMYRYNNSYSYTDMQSLIKVQSDTLWRRPEVGIDDQRSHAHTFQVGMNYNRNKYSFGVKYDGSFSNGNLNSVENIELFNDFQKDAVMFVNTNKATGSNSTNHRANVFYWLTLSKYWKIKMNGDYIHQQYLGDYSIKNEVSKSRDSLAYGAKNAWDMFAFQFSLNYSNKKYGNLALGANTSIVDGYSQTNYTNSGYQSGKTNLNEKRYSFFLSYNLSWKRWVLQAGLRYDWYSTESKNVYTGFEHEEHYPDWKPSFSLSYNTESLYQTLSYSMSITRPQYAELNANRYYVNPFTYSKGNLNLKRQEDHSLSYSLYWKNLYANIGYAYMKNMIALESDIAPEKSYATVNYMMNRDLTHALVAVLNYRYPVKFWEPSVNLFIHKTFYKYSHLGMIEHSKAPIFLLSWSNLFKVSPTLRFSLDYQQWFKGDIYNNTSYPYATVNIQVQKTFLKDQLQLVLGCNDLFKKAKTQGTSRFNALHLKTNTVTNSQRVYFRLIYRFNRSLSKNEYKGESAANEELNRLTKEADE